MSLVADEKFDRCAEWCAPTTAQIVITIGNLLVASAFALIILNLLSRSELSKIAKSIFCALIDTALDLDYDNKTAAAKQQQLVLKNKIK